MTEKKKKNSLILTIVFAVISIFWVYPIFVILFNSLKNNRAISTSDVFNLPTAKSFTGLADH